MLAGRPGGTGRSESLRVAPSPLSSSGLVGPGADHHDSPSYPFNGLPVTELPARGRLGDRYFRVPTRYLRASGCQRLGRGNLPAPATRNLKTLAEIRVSALAGRPAGPPGKQWHYTRAVTGRGRGKYDSEYPQPDSEGYRSTVTKR